MECIRRSCPQFAFIVLMLFSIVASGQRLINGVTSAVYDEWPTFKCDNERTGFSQSVGPVTNNTAWIFNTGEDTGEIRHGSSPIYVEGKIFFGSGDGHIYCLNGSTGGLIWKYLTGEMVTSGAGSPAFSKGRLFVGSRDKYFYCLNASTGDYLWHRRSDEVILSSPVIAQNKVFIGLNNSVFALNEATGATIWSYETNGTVLCAPAVSAGRVIVGSDDKYYYCLNASTGQFLWKYNTNAPGDWGTRSVPSIHDDRVFVGTWDGLWCLDASTGAAVWNYTKSTPPYYEATYNNPAVAYDRVFICFSGYEDGLFCFNESTGIKKWSHTSDDYVIRSSPVVADGKVYVGLTYTIYCVEALTGNPIWTYETGSLPTSDFIVYLEGSPCIASEQVFVKAGDGRLYAFKPPVLTINSQGVSQHNPITLTLDDTTLGTCYDDAPLEHVFHNTTTPITKAVKANAFRVWNTNPNARYAFSEWTGPATGTTRNNPTTITLYYNSSCTAHFQTQHRINMTFTDDSGTIPLTPTRIDAVAPNGSVLALTSFTNQWLDAGTWTIKKILWHGTNVKPSVDPSYTTSPGGTWSVNCLAYVLNFSSSFKDSGGTPLYTPPSAFTLRFPNGTVSLPLPVGSYLLQNGTTAWQSIVWQGTDVIPDAVPEFDATQGNPLVNCSVYSLQIEPTFRDNTGSNLTTPPSSWVVQYPNGTVRTLDEGVTYYQTQRGTYSLVSIPWQDHEVIPLVPPSMSLTNNAVWTPTIHCRLPTHVGLLVRSTTIDVGSIAYIHGNLTCNDAGLSGVSIQLSYMTTGETSRRNLMVVKTTVYGIFSGEWVPPAIGSYMIQATWAGNATYPSSSATVNIAVISRPIQTQLWIIVGLCGIIAGALLALLTKRRYRRYR